MSSSSPPQLPGAAPWIARVPELTRAEFERAHAGRMSVDAIRVPRVIDGDGATPSPGSAGRVDVVLASGVVVGRFEGVVAWPSGERGDDGVHFLVGGVDDKLAASLARMAAFGREHDDGSAATDARATDAGAADARAADARAADAPQTVHDDAPASSRLAQLHAALAQAGAEGFLDSPTLDGSDVVELLSDGDSNRSAIASDDDERLRESHDERAAVVEDARARDGDDDAAHAGDVRDAQPGASSTAPAGDAGAVAAFEPRATDFDMLASLDAADLVSLDAARSIAAGAPQIVERIDDAPVGTDAADSEGPASIVDAAALAAGPTQAGAAVATSSQETSALQTSAQATSAPESDASTHTSAPSPVVDTRASTSEGDAAPVDMPSGPGALPALDAAHIDAAHIDAEVTRIGAPPPGLWSNAADVDVDGADEGSLAADWEDLRTEAGDDAAPDTGSGADDVKARPLPYVEPWPSRPAGLPPLVGYAFTVSGRGGDMQTYNHDAVAWPSVGTTRRGPLAVTADDAADVFAPVLAPVGADHDLLAAADALVTSSSTPDAALPTTRAAASSPLIRRLAHDAFARALLDADTTHVDDANERAEDDPSSDESGVFASRQDVPPPAARAMRDDAAITRVQTPPLAFRSLRDSLFADAPARSDEAPASVPAPPDDDEQATADVTGEGAPVDGNSASS